MKKLAVVVVTAIGTIAFILLWPAQTPSQVGDFQEQHALAHLENLPVTFFEDYTLVFPELQATADLAPSSTSQQR